MNFKKKLTRYVPIIILLTMIVLTGCATSSHDSQVTERLYQPAYLYLPKNQPLQTKEGVYVPQVEEKWVAGWKYSELEAEVIRLATAVRQLQNRETIK